MEAALEAFIRGLDGDLDGGLSEKIDAGGSRWTISDTWFEVIAVAERHGVDTSKFE